jgi:hypothetical protein
VRILVLGAALLGLGGAALWFASRAPLASTAGAGAPTSRELDPQDLAPSLVAPQLPTPARTAESIRSEAPAPVASTSATIRGRVVDGSGAAVIAAGWTVASSPGEPLLVHRHGAPAPFEAHGAGDGEGRFELQLEPHPAAQYALTLEAPGFARGFFGGAVLAPGAVLDLGALVLVPACPLTVRLETATGEPPRGRWVIEAATWPRSAQPEDSAAADPLDGSVRFEFRPPGPNVVWATGPNGSSVSQEVVVLEAGRAAQVVLRYAGPDLSERLEFTFVHDLPYEFQWAVEGLRLVGPDGAEVPLRPGPGGSHVAEPVPDLEHELQLDDPRFVPLRRDDLRPGRKRSIRLEGSASLRLELHSAADGAPVGEAALSVRFPSPPAHWKPRGLDPHQRLQRAGPLPPDGRIEGLYPLEQTLRVEAQGFVPLEVSLGTVAPREVRALRLELTPASVVSGRLRWPDGTPARGFVALSPDGADIPIRMRPDGGFSRTPPLQSVWADEEGSFEFRDLAAGRYGLAVEATPFLVHWFRGVDAVESGGALQVFELPAPASLSGRVRASESTAGVLRLQRLPVFPIGPAQMPLASQFDPPYPLQVELRGTDLPYRFDALGPGDYELQLSPAHRSNFFGSSSAGRVLARVSLAPGEQRTLDLELDGPDVGSLEVDVTVAGTRRGDLTLIASRWSAAGEVEHRRLDLDAAGRGRLAGLEPGDHCLRVEAKGALIPSWVADGPAAVRVSPGERSRVAFDVDPILAKIRLVAASGTPLPSRATVAVFPLAEDRPPRPQRFARGVDAAGVVLWTEPRGEVRVQVLRGFGASEEVLHELRTFWPPDGGQLVVQMP